MTDVDYWETAYQKDQKIWGDSPSELALAADQYIKEENWDMTGKRLLDAGCGYGRDTLFLARRWSCAAVGIDPAQTAVHIARDAAAHQGLSQVAFAQAAIQEWPQGPYDIVLAANLYQILRFPERHAFRQAADRLLAPGGLLFLGIHSVLDPELAGKGEPVAGDPNSYVEKHFYHLSTREELESDFSFLRCLRLYEHEFFEPRSNGPEHHHITWIFIGQKGK
jgi:cyclopropane fatty-acyl-phospholipid synthase-like methyltransferase